MGRKARKIQGTSSDDEAPEAVSHSRSKADAKRSQKTLQNFEAEEKARRKARNRERDQKLKERARVTKGGKTGEKRKGVRFTDRALEEESSEDGNEDAEARMLRAMRDAAGEMESGEGEEEEFQGMDLGDGMDSGSDSDASFAQDEDDAGLSLGEGDSTDSDDEMDEGPTSTRRSSRKADYLADDLFAAAFASQNSKAVPKKNLEVTQQQTVKKRRPRTTRPKDLVTGGRTIRTLPKLSDPRSQAIARSLPSARARRFVDQSLAIRGKQAILKAKKRGWERRPANVGVMKSHGAPHGFARSAG